MMKLLAISLVVIVVAVNSQGEKKKSSLLLGGDDLDKKMAIKLEDDKPGQVEAPKNLREIKKLVKDDRIQLKEMQTRARALKHQIAEKGKSKSEKTALKKQFRELKQGLHTKKGELLELKKEMKVKKQEKRTKHVGGNSKRAGKGQSMKNMLFVEEKKELSSTTTKPATTKPTTTKATTTKPTTPKPTTPKTTEASPALLEFNKKSSRRKSQRKNEKKANKKNKNRNRDFLNKMQGDQPILTSSRGHRRRTPCKTQADCHDGMHCITNKKGHMHCKSPHGTNKPAGKKCHDSEQCMKGLKCFVTVTKEQATHKRHPRRGKGVCADPATTDTSKGHFIPFKSSTK